MGRRKENGRKGKGENKKDVVEGEWRKVGDEGVKVVGVILLLELVALTLTVAWKPNQSVSIHTESGFMWADSSAGLYDRTLVSHGHSFFWALFYLSIMIFYFFFCNSIVYVCKSPLFICTRVSICRWIRFMYQPMCNCTWASVLACTCDGLFVHAKVEGHHV